MGLSIKNDETEGLVRELARRKGIGVTTAIHLAVSNELERTPPPKKDPEAIMAAVRAIQAQVAQLGGLPTMQEIDDWMYDENGLPH
jgi:antitoxin VapB